MQYPKILAFVEGSMEQLFLNNNFHYVEVVPISNGTSWSVSALCRQVTTFFLAKNSNANAFVVWIDRERRQESAQEIEDMLKSALIDSGAEADRVHILVCDLMTENLILSDEQFIREKFGDPEYEYGEEGRGGKHILRKMFLGLEGSYRETSHGVAALKAIRLARCALKNPSAARFLQLFNFPCWWVGNVEV